MTIARGGTEVAAPLQAPAPVAADHSQPHAHPPGMARVPALDGLRGLAVAAVLLFHGGYLTGGWLGVDLFFVLSGYLITSLLLIEVRGSGSIGLRAFWGRRARRLLPGLLAMVVAVAFYARDHVARTDLGAVRSDGLASLFFVANWHDIASGASYWDRGLAPSMFSHAWSLAVEEQLYLLWPLMVALIVRRRTERAARHVVGLALVAAACSLAITMWLQLRGASLERIYLGTDTRSFAVFLGAFVAGWRRQRKGVAPVGRRLEVAAIAAGVVLLAAWWGLDGTSALTYRGGLIGASLLAAVVVAAAADPGSRRLAAVLGLRPLRALGLISYGVYLWHWPVYVVLSPERTPLDGLPLLVVRLAVTLVIAWACWTWIERPVRERRPPGWWTGRRGAWSGVSAVAVVACILLIATSGAITLPTGSAGEGVERPADPPPGLPKVVVLGDSVAYSVAAPALEDPAAFGLEVVRSDILGCQAAWDGVHEGRGESGETERPLKCPPNIEGLVRSERPDAVLVLYGGTTDSELKVDGRWVDSCDPGYRRVLRDRFGEILREAGASGAPVVVSNAARTSNTFRPDDSWDHTACSNAVMEDVASSAGAGFIDLDAWVCPRGKCRDQVDGMTLRADGVHFTGPSGPIAARWVFDRVAALAGLEQAARSGGVETPGFEARTRVCRNRAALSWFLATGVVDSPVARLEVLDAVGPFDAGTVGALPADLAEQIGGLLDPAFSLWAVDAVGHAALGRAVSPDALPPGAWERAQASAAALGKAC